MTCHRGALSRRADSPVGCYPAPRLESGQNARPRSRIEVRDRMRATEYRHPRLVCPGAGNSPDTPGLRKPRGTRYCCCGAIDTCRSCCASCGQSAASNHSVPSSLLQYSASLVKEQIRAVKIHPEAGIVTWAVFSFLQKKFATRRAQPLMCSRLS